MTSATYDWCSAHGPFWALIGLGALLYIWVGVFVAGVFTGIEPANDGKEAIVVVLAWPFPFVAMTIVGTCLLTYRLVHAVKIPRVSKAVFSIPRRAGIWAGIRFGAWLDGRA